MFPRNYHLPSLELPPDTIPAFLVMAESTKQINDTIPLKGSQRTQFDFPEDFDHSEIPLEADEIPVVIIGSSMVGMFMGLLLGYHGYVRS